MCSLNIIFTALAVAVLASAEHVCYVQPSNTSSWCPGQPCLTLDEYAKQQERYFTDGVTFRFLAGKHSLSSGLQLIDISDITFIEDSQNLTVNMLSQSELALIYCHNVTNFTVHGITLLFGDVYNNASFFNFFNSSEIFFTNLVFHGRFDLLNKSLIRPVLFNHSNAEIENCLFEGSTAFNGGTIYAYFSNITLVANTFVLNRALHSGGAVFAENSTIILKGGVFKENVAVQGGGGAIYLQDSVSLLSGMLTVFENNSAVLGGALYSLTSTVDILSGKSHFTGNQAEVGGGAYFGSNSSLNTDPDTYQFFQNNLVLILTGGGIDCQYGSVTLTGNSEFVGNSVRAKSIRSCGGGIYNIDCQFTLSGNASFAYNRASGGGAICLITSILLSNGTSIDFVENEVDSGGGAVSLTESTATMVNGQINFINNSAKSDSDSLTGGGAIFLSLSHISLSNFNFSGNSAKEGGGIYCTYSYYTLSSGKFINNSASMFGGAVLMVRNNDISHHHDVNVMDNNASAMYIAESNTTFSGTTVFTGNSGKDGGGIAVQHSVLTFEGNTIFENNHALLTGGAVQATYRNSLYFDGITSFLNNTAEQGGAIALYIKTNLMLSGEVLLNNNSAQYGGALYSAVDTSTALSDSVTLAYNLARLGGGMYFENGATINLEVNANLTMLHNHATAYGGGMYHVDGISFSQCQFTMSNDPQTLFNITTLPNCFLDLHNFSSYNYTILSDSNLADIDGHFLYGGLIDKCRIIEMIEKSENLMFSWDILYSVLTSEHILKIKPGHTNSSVNVLTSEANVLCFCSNNTNYNCTESTNVEVYKGRKFNISLLALAQGNSITSTSLRAESSPMIRLQLDQTSQDLPKNCAIVTYTLYSSETKGELVLYPDNRGCRDSGLARAVINVTFLKCPDAFSQSDDHCTCEERLLAYNAQCIVTDTEFYIKKKTGSRFWMKALYLNDEYKGLVLYKTCPTEYCKTEEVNITLSNQDIQCDSHRSKVLCGACATNYSLMLGSARCGICSHTYLTLLVPFAVAGIALVILLSLLRLTVATGMINSIILYANILQANKSLLDPSSTTTNVLTVFIAWMNLDLGIQTCFYHGMTAYAQTWLQFAFPIYIWLLMGSIIIVSRYSSTMTKLIGSNPISVLATLLLMSYTKVLKNIIEIYSSVKLDYPGNATATVWLKDANVVYLESWHLLLAIVTTVFVGVLFLPYTLFLLLGYKLYRFSGRKYFRWLHNFKPLLDSYYAPYEKHTRYWTGLLLLVRCALYTVFSSNPLGGTKTSLLSIVTVFTALVVLAWLSVRVYTSFYHNAVEGVVYLNLIALSAAASNDANSAKLVNSLVGIVFSIMMGIIAYHFHHLYIAKSSAWSKITAKVIQIAESLRPKAAACETDPLLLPVNPSPGGPPKRVPVTEICVRESLLVQ